MSKRTFDNSATFSCPTQARSGAAISAGLKGLKEKIKNKGTADLNYKVTIKWLTVWTEFSEMVFKMKVINNDIMQHLCRYA
jgi:hypothetical protein